MFVYFLFLFFSSLLSNKLTCVRLTVVIKSQYIHKHSNINQIHSFIHTAHHPGRRIYISVIAETYKDRQLEHTVEHNSFNWIDNLAKFETNTSIHRNKNNWQWSSSRANQSNYPTFHIQLQLDAINEWHLNLFCAYASATLTPKCTVSPLHFEWCTHTHPNSHKHTHIHISSIQSAKRKWKIPGENSVRLIATPWSTNQTNKTKIK